MNENTAANKLDQEKHSACSALAIDIFNTHHPLLSQSLSDPVNVSIMLQREGVITGQVLASVESASPSVPNQREVLLAAIRVAIESKYSLLQTFASVLCKFTGNVKLGTAIQRSHEPSGSDSNKSTPTNVAPLYIPQYKSRDFDVLYAKFAEMFANVRKVIFKFRPPLKELKMFIEDFDSDLEAELSLIKNLQGVMRLIRNNCRLINIVILEAVVKHFKIDDAQKYIDDYKRDIDESCHNLSVDLCLNEPFDVVRASPPLKCETATYVLGWEATEHKLKDVTEIVSKSSDKFVKILDIKSIESITITCSFPHSLTGALIIKLSENLELLIKNGLMKLTVGYCTIWKKKVRNQTLVSPHPFTQTQKVLATSVDNTNQLQITDLAEVLQLLKRHGFSATTYYDLGLYFGLSSATLTVIIVNSKGNVLACLCECLKAWLEKADDVQKKGGPTIYSLVSALRELGENGVADGIDMEKHPACKILACHLVQQSLLTALPQLVILLQIEKMIKEMILPANIQGEDLLIQIKETVCKDYQKLKVFAEILCKVKAFAEIGNTIMKEYREAYCTNDFIQANDAIELKIYLPINVTLQLKMMRLKMGQTFFKVGSIMMSNPQSPSLDNIKSVLRTYDKALRPQVAQCQDIRELLELVCDNCQLDDISMLEFFVNEFNIEEAKPVIKEYKEAVEELKEIKLSQCLEEQLSYPLPLECEIIIIIVDKDTYKTTLRDVQRLSSAVLKNLSPHVEIIVIGEGN
ncbi:PREDICTED: uncharacterized protein LOC109585709 [Amphimedon queenslandica]|uniref:Death domain-containing protein n=1 Tax=Amphimedon queenslandica TaxID=400682 RepID=A0AAN0JK72_AMPQE|nr:PREDICTED: uncharacterized protein LOC109585709 [Amphimedon queenslandica]|eukprot:XP_019857393.1 PREDICTED: uncharacterized protein LOC109585709 [Amphimedon queenslandica]